MALSKAEAARLNGKKGGRPRKNPDVTDAVRRSTSKPTSSIKAKKDHRPHGGRQLTHEERARIAERRLQVWNLKRAGASFATIAKQLGCDQRTAWEDYWRTIDELNELRHEGADEFRHMERERLESLWLALQPKVRAGDAYAIGEARKVSESLRKLYGVDAPLKVAPTTPDGHELFAGVDDRLTRLLGEIATARDSASAPR